MTPGHPYDWSRIKMHAVIKYVGIVMCTIVIITPLAGCKQASSPVGPTHTASPPIQCTVLHLVVETAVSAERASIIIVWRSYGADAVVQLEARSDGRWQQVLITTVPVAVDIIAVTDRLQKLEYEQPAGTVTSDGPLCFLSIGPGAKIQFRNVDIVRDLLLSLGLNDVCNAFCGAPKSFRLRGMCADEANAQRLPIMQTE